MSIYMGHNYPYADFCPVREFYDTSSPDFLVTSFPIMSTNSIQVPDHLAKPLAIAHAFVYYATSGHSSFQSEQPSALLKVLPTRRISLHHCSFKAVSQGGCNASTVYFLVVPAYCAELSVNQA